MRIKASGEGARVVAPVRSLETRAAAPEKAPSLEEGTRIAVAEPAPPPPAEASRSAKPPPPHIQRGGSPRTAPREHEAPAGKPTVATPAEPAPVRIKVAEARPKPTETPAPVLTEPEGEHAAHAADHDNKAPHIHTDAGRLSALWSAMAIVLLVFLVELYAGAVSNSLALFSDAGHVFMDLFSYGIAYAAVTVSQRRSNARETFGGHRAEIVAAFISGLLLLLVVGLIYLEAVGRLTDPDPVTAAQIDQRIALMTTVPLLAIAANLYLARRFRGAADLNMRGARMHVISDLLSALGVLFAGVLILATRNVVFDPLVSFFIGLLILRGAIELLRDSSEILLERTPAHVKMEDVLETLRRTPGVEGVHSVHVWSLCSSVHALSAHIVSGSAVPADAQRLLSAVRTTAEKNFGIHFTTIQIETVSCGADEHPTVAHSVAESVAHAHSHA